MDIINNINSHLGDLPNNQAERRLFIYNAKNKVTKALQALGYYRSDITITTLENTDGPWHLNIEVMLNEPTLVKSTKFIISGDGQTDPIFKEFIRQNIFEDNKKLNHGIYEDFKISLTSLALKYGYFDARFLESRIAIHQSYHSAEIYIHFDTGQQYHFGEINFSDVEIEDELLTQLVPFKASEPYHIKHLREFQNQLVQTQYFDNVIITPKTNISSDGKIPIDVNLEINDKHHLEFGIGYATDTDLRVSAGWETPLINSYGHQQKTKITYSRINPVGQFNYTIPLSHPLKDILQFELRLEDDIYGDISSKYWSARLSRIRNKTGLISEYYLRYLQEDWSRDGDKYATTYFIPGITWSKVTRGGSPVNPSKGFSQYYNLEISHTAIEADINLARFHAKWKYITNINEKHRFVARAEFGILEPDSAGLSKLSPSLRFFTGGDQSIRGFAYHSIGSRVSSDKDISDGQKNQLVVGGSRLSVGSFEYQYQFAEKWRAVLFVDAGDAYTKNNMKLKYSIGPGIHYLSPIGAIRLDLGYSLSKDNPSWRIHFNLGAEL
ncbi:autotransporter assembly complex family protein [Colwelliaceae bacterium 6471]